MLGMNPLALGLGNLAGLSRQQSMSGEPGSSSSSYPVGGSPSQPCRLGPWIRVHRTPDAEKRRQRRPVPGGYLRRAGMTKPEQLQLTLGKRRIDRRERMRGFHIIDFPNSQNRSQLICRDFHRSGLWCGSRSGLREGRRHRGVKTHIAFHLLYYLMNVSVKHCHRTKSL
jgi:hypothetical protein